jgi:hypothetical protein
MVDVNKNGAVSVDEIIHFVAREARSPFPAMDQSGGADKEGGTGIPR